MFYIVDIRQSTANIDRIKDIKQYYHEYESIEIYLIQKHFCTVLKYTAFKLCGY